LKVWALEVEKNGELKTQTPSDTSSEVLHGTLLTFSSSFETLYSLYVHYQICVIPGDLEH